MVRFLELDCIFFGVLGNSWGLVLAFVNATYFFCFHIIFHFIIRSLGLIMTIINAGSALTTKCYPWAYTTSLVDK